MYLCVAGAECALVIKPQNEAAYSGKVVTLYCASSVSTRGNIAWSITDPGNFIYAQDQLARNFTSYISVNDIYDGNCSLTINASLATANRYICTELSSGDSASAELIVLGRCSFFLILPR